MMRRCAVYTLLALAPIAWAAEAAPTEPAVLAGKGYHLVKDWDFAANMRTLDDLHQEFYTRYTSDNGTKDHLNDEWQVYRDHDNHAISKGALHLIARVLTKELKVGAIESGMIRSKWEGAYGYYEARMKLPRGRGMWPAFWFSNEYWPPEVDVVEVVNNGVDTTRNSYHALHGKFIGKTVSSLLNDRSTYVPGFDYADGFHTFAVEWTPTAVKHYVDNVLVVEREFEWRHDNGEAGHPAPVVVNLAVGGSWPGAPTSLNEFPASLDVAYIRVWQR